MRRWLSSVRLPLCPPQPPPTNARGGAAGWSARSPARQQLGPFHAKPVPGPSLGLLVFRVHIGVEEVIDGEPSHRGHRQHERLVLRLLLRLCTGQSPDVPRGLSPSLPGATSLLSLALCIHMYARAVCAVGDRVVE